MTFGSWFWAGAALSALLLLIGHWFPWPRQLHRLEAYVYGVACILGGFALWHLQVNGWHAVLGLTVIAVVSGLAVFAAYGVDWVVAMIRKAWKAERLLDDRPE